MKEKISPDQSLKISVESSIPRSESKNFVEQLHESMPTPTNSLHKGNVSRPTMLQFHWYESWIIRAAFIAALILLLGFAVSGFFTYSSIDSIANISHDPEVEKSLQNHLDSLKKIHELQQQLLLSRLKPKASQFFGDHLLTAEKLEEILVEQTKDLDLGQGPWTILKMDPEKERIAHTRDLGDFIRWTSLENLQVYDYSVHFPRSSTYEMFKKTEDLKQRYQLIGFKLQDQIIPSLIKTSAVVLLVSFLVLVSLFLAYAQAFKSEINDVIEGFTIWSEKDVKFRFYARYPGELGLITNQFNQMAEEVEANRQKSLYLEKIASWQIIARKLAHEIKNPLTPIQMMVSQLKRRYKGDDPAFGKLLEEAQTIITEEISGLRRMVDSFSQFARLPEPIPRRTDLVTLCKHVVDMQKNIFTQHRFSLISASNEIIAEIDDDLIRQVILNIVKNAGEACQERGADISLRLSESPVEAMIEVHDNGDGIPQELLDRIFEAYFTTKHTGPNPGMGLGLAVCQKIVMDHRGTMGVTSTKGHTVFSIRLPKKWKQ
jgi:nitrogen fixation/metabolism regulation signal transduction histidine kinase